MMPKQRPNTTTQSTEEATERAEGQAELDVTPSDAAGDGHLDQEEHEERPGGADGGTTQSGCHRRPGTQRTGRDPRR